MGNNTGKQIASVTYHAYRTFFSTEEGEAVLKDLMKSCFFFQTTVAPTPEVTYFNEGKRNVVMQIIETAKLSPEKINKLVGQVQQEEAVLYDEFQMDGDGGTV